MIARLRNLRILPVELAWRALFQLSTIPNTHCDSVLMSHRLFLVCTAGMQQAPQAPSWWLWKRSDLPSAPPPAPISSICTSSKNNELNQESNDPKQLMSKGGQTPERATQVTTERNEIKTCLCHVMIRWQCEV